MVQPLGTLPETASQTAGPYVHIGLVPTFAGLGGIYARETAGAPFAEGAAGDVVEIAGTVSDGTGWVLRDALIETWQADAAGRYPGTPGADPKVSGWTRVCADPESGEWTLRTIRPGPAPARGGGVQAPHIALWIVARGINTGLQTRLYFEGDDHDGDPLLARIEQRSRVATLIARRTAPGRYRFDIRLQGEGETVFLDM